jgi:hypothetical protein
MARYRKIDVRIWSDEKFRRLSPPKPNAQSLWFFLLTNRFTTNIPGLYSAGEAALAEELAWPLAGFRKAFDEIRREGMADADWTARVVWVPKAIRYHEPESPNVIKRWRVAFDEIPDCLLKDTAVGSLRVYAQGLSEGFTKAFQEAFREGSLQVLRKAMPNQEQEQDQKKEPKIIAPSSEKPATAPTPFVSFVRAEWRDLKNPAAFEKRVRKAFPGIDPLTEAQKARGWELADPQHLKVKHGRFLWNWMTTADERMRNGDKRGASPRNGATQLHVDNDALNAEPPGRKFL